MLKERLDEEKCRNSRQCMYKMDTSVSTKIISIFQYNLHARADSLQPYLNSMELWQKPIRLHSRQQVRTTVS